MSDFAEKVEAWESWRNHLAGRVARFSSIPRVFAWNTQPKRARNRRGDGMLTQARANPAMPH